MYYQKTKNSRNTVRLIFRGENKVLSNIINIDLLKIAFGVGIENRIESEICRSTQIIKWQS